MSMEFSRGKPHENGRYLAYVKDLSAPEWLRPMILSWFNGRWYFPQSDSRYWETVFLWQGPLPCGKLNEIAILKMEYDL